MALLKAARPLPSRKCYRQTRTGQQVARRPGESRHALWPHGSARRHHHACKGQWLVSSAPWTPGPSAMRRLWRRQSMARFEGTMSSHIRPSWPSQYTFFECFDASPITSYCPMHEHAHTTTTAMGTRWFVEGANKAADHEGADGCGPDCTSFRVDRNGRSAPRRNDTGGSIVVVAVLPAKSVVQHCSKRHHCPW
jgi:hypothetical protein